MDENEDEYDTRKSNRIVVLLDQAELEVLNFMACDQGLSNSAFTRQLILRQFREEYGNKKKQ